MTTQGKIWGETTEFFRFATSSGHHLSIKAGGYCSIHKHAHKYNLFYVMSGKLKVTIWRDEDRGLKDETILGEGQTTAVPPDFFHKFEALEDTECIEVYHVLLNEPDIERKSVGGYKR